MPEPSDCLSPNFRRSEFACADGCGWSEPDPGLVAGLQALREVVGKPIKVLSGCRCAAHNQAVGGALSSRHLTGEAADIRCIGIPARDLYAHAAAILRFKGFGLSVEGDYLHVDVRPKLARWIYRDGKQVPWADA
jgi:uncharacterized protein YcbK (DUF882 family)